MVGVQRPEHVVGRHAVVEPVDEAVEEGLPPTCSYSVGSAMWRSLGWRHRNRAGPAAASAGRSAPIDLQSATVTDPLPDLVLYAARGLPPVRRRARRRSSLLLADRAARGLAGPGARSSATSTPTTTLHDRYAFMIPVVALGERSWSSPRARRSSAACSRTCSTGLRPR